MTGPTLAVALALALGGPAVPATAAEPTAPLPEAATAPAAPPPLPWGPGERMDFDIDYLGITMGRARIEVGATEGGATPVQLSSRSAGLASIITFRQTLVSELDVATLLPRTSVLDAEEPGGYHHTDTARFDRAAGSATVREQGRFDKSYLVEVPEGTLDFVALVFRLRTLPLPDGATHAFQVLAGRKVTPVVAAVVKREPVKTDAGRFAAVKVRVPTGFDGKFSEKNPTYVWFSDDERRVVVRISTDFAIGRAEAGLTAYRPRATAPALLPAGGAEPPRATP
jgi:nicotinamide mononucleotide adenylyltransferase